MGYIKNTLKFIHLWFVSKAEYDSTWLCQGRPLTVLVIKSIAIEHYPKVAYKVKADLLDDLFTITELDLLRSYEELHV